jgi:hypothetical protein
MSYLTNNISEANIPTTDVISLTMIGKNTPDVIAVKVALVPSTQTIVIVAGSAAVPIYIAEGDVGLAGKAETVSIAVPKSG